MKPIQGMVLALMFSLTQATLFSQITDPKATEIWEPVPRKVDPGDGVLPPSDAIVLFNGKSADEWTDLKGNATAWTIADGVLTVKPGSGDIKTRRLFGDCQLHIEWRSPIVVKGEGQGRGNSGVYLQERYELQVLDSYESRTYSNGQAASIYKQSIPLVNATKKPGEWQAYDILFTAPRFNADGVLVAPAHITVLHNGIVVQHHTEIKGNTEYIGLPAYRSHGDASLKLQDHGDLVSYRNIWIRAL